MKYAAKQDYGCAAGRRGQAMVEYIIIAGMLLTSVAVLSLFLATFKEYGWRILDMIASDYP